MIKRETIILYILIAAAFLLCGTISVSADGCDEYGIYVNDTKLDSEITIQVINDINYVSLNQISSSLNISQKEEKASKTIIITQGTKTIKILNNNTAEINDGAKMQLDFPLILKENNIYLPVLSLVDILGYQVEVMDSVSCIRIRTTDDTMPAGKLVDMELNKLSAAGKMISSDYSKVAYLTFDDGLSSKVTPFILDILKKEDIKATFFIVGNTIEKNKLLLKRIVDEGHSIGNHTFTHKKENLYVSASDLESELEKTSAALFDAAGIVTKLFRPPYGGTYIKNEVLQPALASYRTILWNVDSMDSRSKTISSTEIYNSVVNQVKNKKTAIIIMHDSGTHMETAKALPSIIRYLKENGFIILPIEENTNIYYKY